MFLLIVLLLLLLLLLLFLIRKFFVFSMKIARILTTLWWTFSYCENCWDWQQLVWGTPRGHADDSKKIEKLEFPKKSDLFAWNFNVFEKVQNDRPGIEKFHLKSILMRGYFKKMSIFSKIRILRYRPIRIDFILKSIFWKLRNFLIKISVSLPGNRFLFFSPPKVRTNTYLIGILKFYLIFAYFFVLQLYICRRISGLPLQVHWGVRAKWPATFGRPFGPNPSL